MSARFGFAVALAAALYAAPAQAVYQCGGNNPYPCCDNGGNCTWSAWESACCNWKVALPGWGNANQWAGNARNHPSYDALSYPVTSSVACNASGTYGHVAWVTGFSGSQVTVTEQNCWGNYGTRSSTYQTASFTGGFIVRTGTVACRPGDTQTQSCGNCGQQSRGCKNDGSWAAWGTCSSQGVCAPGAREELGCADCGKKARACRSDCSWGTYGACAGTDPDGGLGPCDTGKSGSCAQGTLHCGGDGVRSCEQQAQPAAESCNGLDDDCDGHSDEEAVCSLNGRAVVVLDAAPTRAQPFDEKTPAADSVLGSCSQVGPLASAWALLGLSALLRRRSKPRR